MTDRVLPIGRDDWVADFNGFRVARVVRAYWDSLNPENPEVLFDGVLYSLTGERIGRSSPAAGGPSRLEPALTYTGTWERIAAPNFPLEESFIWAPTGNGGRVATRVVRGLVRRAERVTMRQPKKRVLPPKPPSDFDPRLEASSRRMAAQELRDVARTVAPEAAVVLKAQATKLEAEADAIFPRTL